MSSGEMMPVQNIELYVVHQFLDIDPELIPAIPLRRDDGRKEVGVHREQQLQLRDGGGRFT